jgi:hypothetical protein
MKAFLVIASMLLMAGCSSVAASDQKPTDLAKAVLGPGDSKKAENCRTALEAVHGPHGGWRAYRFENGYGTVEVSDGFYLTSFDNKRVMDATMRCVFSNGRDENAGVSQVKYVDFRTHKEVALWSSVTGFSVD